MSVAIDPKNVQINLLFTSGSVPIPRSHPAYSGGACSARRFEARLWSATLATIAGLLLIAAFSGGAAHYMLRIAELHSEVPPAIDPAIADPPAAAPAAPEPATASAMAEPESLPAAALAADPPGEAARMPALKRPAKRPVKAAKLLARARLQKPATAPDGENLALAPLDEILPAPMLPLAEPIVPIPRANR